MNIPHYEIPLKNNLKRNIKLIIIDETGDFIEYSNVLIIPRADKPIIINLEHKETENLETIQEIQEETLEETLEEILEEINLETLEEPLEPIEEPLEPIEETNL